MLKERTTKKWSLDEYHRLGETGFFSSDYRAELLNGEIVEMSPVGSLHKACVHRLNKLFSRRVGESALVKIQQPLVVGEEEPVPDVVLLKPNPDDYSDRHTIASDAVLVIEVSNSTLKSDQEVKMPKYAAAAIPKLWVVDLNADRVWIRREPKSGSHTQIQAYERSHSLSVQALPDVSLTVRGNPRQVGHLVPDTNDSLAT